MHAHSLGLDHVVLICADVEASLRWWHETLGLPTERVQAWRSGEAPFPSVRLSAATIIDLLAGERSGENVAHLALNVDVTGGDLAGFAAEKGLDVLSGPARLFGARGEGLGLYVRDPDGNTIELRTYS